MNKLDGAIDQLLDSLKKLTKRERQVARRYVQGESYKRIAEALFVSPSTVRSHLNNIYEKLGVHSKAELVSLILVQSDDKTNNELSRSNGVDQFTKAESINLPSIRSRLIGREQELREIIKLLQRPDLGLITLTGAGGSGKTRLGLDAAREMVTTFQQRVYFVSLATVHDPDFVATAIIKTLGLQESGQQTPLDRLKDYLQSKTLLLVLDNFEQILAAAPQVADLLAYCPGLKILVTSRAALQIRDEYEYPVLPLSLPDLNQQTSSDQLSQYAAIILFVERAAAIRSNFTFNNDNAAILAAICIRLDGLPLAIELAAARLRILSPQALLGRLERRLPLLTGGARDLPHRQQTLRATIAWSYDLLSRLEQRLFHTLAIFFGGCSLNAIEALWQAQESDQSEMLDALESLLTMNLLRQVEGIDGEPRYLMLETIREYGLEQLEMSGEIEHLRRCHAQYFLTLLEEIEAKLRGSEQAQCLDQLEMELANIRAALGWSLESSGEPEWGLRMCVVLGWFWRLRGYLGEGCEWLEKNLAAHPEKNAIRSKLLTHLTLLTYSQGNRRRTLALVEESVTIAREMRDETAIGWALHAKGRVFHCSANYVQAAAAFEESLNSFQKTNDIVGKNYSSRYLGDVKRAQCDYLGAAPLMEDGIRFGRQSGDTWGLASAYLAAGCLAYRQKDFDRASKLLKESLIHYWFIRALWGIWFPISNLGSVVAAQGYAKRAACLVGVEKTLRQRVGANMVPSHRADYERGVALARQALSESDFDAAWAKGEAMTTEQAVNYALSSEDEK